MPRQSGYRVTITGFLPVDKKDLQAQLTAIQALAGGDVGAIISQCKSVVIENQSSSREIDDDGNPVPRAPRKPRAVNGDKKRKAA